MTSKPSKFLVCTLSGLLLAGGSALAPTAKAQQPAITRPAAEVSQTLDDKPLIVNTDIVNVTVTVTDSNGRYVEGLERSAFAVFDDKLQQEITFFGDEDAPISVGIVFDMSGSMSGEKISRARQALARFVETSHPGDEYFLIAFDSRARLLLDRTHDSGALLNKVAFVQPGGQTALYDAVYLGVEKVLRGMHQRRALIVISDGEDNNSRYSIKELVRQVKESGVVVYTVGILEPPASSASSSSTQPHEPFFRRPMPVGFSPMESASHQYDRMTLEELAIPSGGRAFLAHSDSETTDVFESIALELRHQYSIGYRPQNFTDDGKWHRIKVRLNPRPGLPRLFVRSREGYYALIGPRSLGEEE